MKTGGRGEADHEYTQPDRKKRDVFEAIYCHYDGYPQNQGPILTSHYATEAAVDALLDLGDLVTLGPQIGKKHSFDAHGPRVEKWSLAYGRDLGEPDTKKRRYASDLGNVRKHLKNVLMFLIGSRFKSEGDASRFIEDHLDTMR